jgi:lantibiotic modifying enzyme
MYAWPESRPKEYAGAAHGILGILYALMLHGEVSERYRDEIVSCLDWVLENVESKRFPGRYPLHVGDHHVAFEDLDVHWCHGATGAVFTFTQAHLSLCARRSCDGNCKWLAAATRAAQVVWTDGLLKKGPGLCHGISGNGYSLLRMYRVTGNVKYLYRAECFAKFLDSSQFLLGCTGMDSDSPYSLYDGLAGAVAFCSDLARLAHSETTPLPIGFPFFEALQG